MKKLTDGLLQVRQYLDRFQKMEKRTQKPRLKTVTPRTMNFFVVGGVATLLFVGLVSSLRSITLSNHVLTLEKLMKEDKEKTLKPFVATTTTDYRLEYYLIDYVKGYFTLSSNADQAESQIKTLNHFYNFIPEVKSQGQVRNPSELLSARLIKIENGTATYQVRYKEIIKKDKDTIEQEIETGFTIPFGEKNGRYYISALPWFSTIEQSQASDFKEDEKLNLSASDSLSEKTHESVEKFLKVFFTNYTTNQDNLNLIAKDVSILSHASFKSLDYVYLKEKGEKLIAYVQTSFEVAGSTHSENFTFTLIQKETSYYVEKLTHIIPLNYATQDKGD